MPCKFVVLPVLLTLFVLPLDTYAQELAEPSPIPVNCGSIVEGEFSSNYELHRYLLEVAPGDKINSYVETLGEQLSVSLTILGPTNLLVETAATDTIGSGGIDRGTYASLQARSQLSTGTLSARGAHTIIVSNTWLRLSNNVDLHVPEYNTRIGGVGVYTLYVGCTLRDGTVIEPGDSLEPETEAESNGSVLGGLVDQAEQAQSAPPAPEFSGFGFPGLAPIDFANVSRLPIPAGVPMSGAVTPNGGEILGYLFEAEADDTVQIDFTRLSGNVNLGIVVINENSDVIFQSSLVTTQTLTTQFTVPSAGEYTAGVFRIDLLPPDNPEATAFQMRVEVNP